MVAAIHSQSDYAPITLSSIVRQVGASVTTKLTVSFQFLIPYLTCEVTPTTFSVATKPNINVNTILGLSLIQQTKIIIDTSDQVADLRALDAPSFIINFWHAMCSVPTIEGKADVSNTKMQYTKIIWKVDSIVVYYAANPSWPASFYWPRDPVASILTLPLWHLPSVRFFHCHYQFVD
jgi:hypothetical protein